MTRPSAEQVLLAARNTTEKPRNAAPDVRRAIEAERQGPIPAAYMDALRRLRGANP
jgi:hypothetical protein